MDWMYNSADKLIDSEEYLLGKRIDKLPGDASNNNFNVTYCSTLGSGRTSSLLDGQADISRKLVEDPLNNIKTMEKLAKDKMIKCSIGMSQYTLKGNSLTKVVDSDKNQETDESGIDEYLTGIVMSQIAKIKIPLNIRRLYKETKRKNHDKTSNAKNNKTYSSLHINTMSIKDNGKTSETMENSDKKKTDTFTDKFSSNNKPVSRPHNASYTCKKNTTRKNLRERFTAATSGSKSTSSNDGDRNNEKHFSRQITSSGRNNFKGIHTAIKKSPKSKNDMSSYKRRRKNIDASSPDGYCRRKRNEKKYSLSYNERKRSRYSESDREEKKHDNVNNKDQYNINGYEPKKIRMGLTEEEKEIRRKEMQEDAKKYQKERKENVLRYEKEDILNASKDTSFSMNRNEFLNETVVSTGTLEKRIKSNLYNIQRQPEHMEKNFARR